MTTDRATLLALADRVEAATGPDREMDAEIAFAVGWRKSRGEWWKPPGGEWGLVLPTFTASLDAALSLVPEGWRWSVDFTQRAPYQDCGRADLYAPGSGYKPADVQDVYAATPALALTAAALRALAQEAPGDER